MYAVIKLHSFGSLRKGMNLTVKNFRIVTRDENADRVPQNPGGGPGKFSVKRIVRDVLAQSCEMQPSPFIEG